MEILLVEDNNADILMIMEAVKESKIIKKCNIVKDGDAALKYLNKEGEYEKSKSPDVILLDLDLPGKSGFEVLVEIKNNPAFHKIPVVIVSCSDNKDYIKKCYDFHANCYVVKPIEIDEFDDIIRRIESFWGEIVALPSVS